MNKFGFVASYSEAQRYKYNAATSNPKMSARTLSDQTVELVKRMVQV